MSFAMIILNQGINKMQNYVTWIHTVLSFILKLKVFIKTLIMRLTKDLMQQIINL